MNLSYAEIFLLVWGVVATVAWGRALSEVKVMSVSITQAVNLLSAIADRKAEITRTEDGMLDIHAAPKG